MENLLKTARDLTANVTPLKRDCGALCGCACCLPDEDGQGGAFLFPGEESAYANASWARVEDVPAIGGRMLVCEGTCPREERPLACRIFPLTPVPLCDGRWSARIDRRARVMCPLAQRGKEALEPAFVDAVVQAVRLLATDPQTEAFLKKWARLERQYRFTL